jgi:hypothetical protein
MEVEQTGGGEISSFLDKLRVEGISDNDIRDISALIIDASDKLVTVTGGSQEDIIARQNALAQELFKKIMAELDITDVPF